MCKSGGGVHPFRQLTAENVTFSPLHTDNIFSPKKGGKGGFIVAALLKVTKCFLFDSLNFHCKQRCKMLIACSYFSPSVKSKWCPRVCSSPYTRFSLFLQKGFEIKTLIGLI